MAISTTSALLALPKMVPASCDVRAVTNVPRPVSLPPSYPSSLSEFPLPFWHFWVYSSLPGMLPSACQVPPFPSERCTTFFSLKPSGTATEQDLPCAFSLLPVFFAWPQHLLEPLSESFGIHLVHRAVCTGSSEAAQWR